MSTPIPWFVPPEVADADEQASAGYRYDAEEFYTGELPVELIECAPYAKQGQSEASSLRLVLGAHGPNGNSIRWDEYLGLDMTKAFAVAQQKGFLNAFAPRYLGSPAHLAGEACDLAQLPGRVALCLVKKEGDVYQGRARNRPRIVRFLGPLPGPTAIDPAKVRSATTAVEQAGGAPRAPAPGARPAPGSAAARPAAPPSAQGAPVAAVRGVPARPAPPAQSALYPSTSGSHEDADLPY